MNRQAKAAPWPLSQESGVSCDRKTQESTVDDIVEEMEDLSISDLPDDLVLLILQFLTPGDMARASFVCKVWSRLSQEPLLWKHFYERDFMSGPSYSESLVVDATSATIVAKPLLKPALNEWRTIHQQLTRCKRAENEENLILEGLGASSIDFASQNVNMTLNRGYERFWSSVGTGPDENEWVMYRLKERAVLLREVQIFFYQAKWQDGSPLYTSKSLQISVGFSKDDMHYVSPIFRVEETENMQTFPISPPLVVGGYLRIDFFGKRQTQPEDDLYYTVLNCVRCRGSRVSKSGKELALAVARSAMAADSFWKGNNEDNRSQPKEDERQALIAKMEVASCEAITEAEVAQTYVWGGKLELEEKAEDLISENMHPAGDDPGHFGRALSQLERALPNAPRVLVVQFLARILHQIDLYEAQHFGVSLSAVRQRAQALSQSMEQGRSEMRREADRDEDSD